MLNQTLVQIEMALQVLEDTGDWWKAAARLDRIDVEPLLAARRRIKATIPAGVELIRAPRSEELSDVDKQELFGDEQYTCRWSPCGFQRGVAMPVLAQLQRVTGRWVHKRDRRWHPLTDTLAVVHDHIVPGESLCRTAVWMCNGPKSNYAPWDLERLAGWRLAEGPPAASWDGLTGYLPLLKQLPAPPVPAVGL